MTDPLADPLPAAAPWMTQWQALAQTRAAQREPLRWAQLQALVRRAEAQPHPLVRQRLDARLHTLVAEMAQRQAVADAAAHGRPPAASDSQAGAPLRARRRQRPTAPPADPGPAPSPLAALTAYLHERARALDDTAPAAVPAVALAAGPPDLRSAARLAQWWGERSAQIDIEQSLRQPPEQAGPLNSQVLAARTLALMQALSPAFTSQWVRRLDTLMWLEQLGAARGAVGASPRAHPAAARRSTP